MLSITPELVKEYISAGESDTVEFKSQLPPEPIISKILSAFANTRGGILLIGVSDSGDIVGIPHDVVNQTMVRLEKVMRSLLPASTEAEASTIDVDGKRLVYVEIGKTPSYLTPIFTSTGSVYERRESSSDIVPSIDIYESSIREKVFSAHPSKNIIAFVAMSFRNEEEPALEDYFRAMQRAAQRTELPIELARIDLQEGDYEISQKIMSEIEKADIAIVDFTLNAQNVYFEIGFARGIRKRVIQCARKGTTLEFDVRNWRTVFYRNATELEEKLITELKAAYADVTG